MWFVAGGFRYREEKYMVVVLSRLGKSYVASCMHAHPVGVNVVFRVSCVWTCFIACWWRCMVTTAEGILVGATSKDLQESVSLLYA